MDNYSSDKPSLSPVPRNYPSVIIWAYMNEVLLRPPFNPENRTERADYMTFLHQIASVILQFLLPDRFEK